MNRLLSLTELVRLYATHGERNYGEDVTQMEHALQTAALAEAHGCAPSLIAASLLHDVGHLFEGEAEVAGFTLDHRHQDTGAKALSSLFTEAVWQPVALHVAAKRYLCFKDAHYFETLSPASQRSLGLQGGPFTATEAESFESMPYWRDAVALRRFDDMGKREEISPRSFEAFMPLLHNLLIGAARLSKTQPH
jgi:phosphonate degradation associated HDIG domain protein